jgi:hypothetical protein
MGNKHIGSQVLMLDGWEVHLYTTIHSIPVNYGCRQGQLQIIKSIEMVIIMFMLRHILLSDVLNGMYLKAMFHIDPCIYGKPWGAY